MKRWITCICSKRVQCTVPMHFQHISSEWLCLSSSSHASVVFPLLYSVQEWNSEAGREEEKLPFIWDAVCGVLVAALDLGPMGRKHVHEPICNGKTNPITMVWILDSKMLRQQMYGKMYTHWHIPLLSACSCIHQESNNFMIILI